MFDAAKEQRIPENWDRSGLPAWTYFNEELLEVEKEVLFLSHWQLVCHESDVRDPGSYLCFDIFGERALIVRGKDGAVRAFHNVCPHRGSRVVAEMQGRCAHAVICPFHGWSFNLDGTLRGPAMPKDLPPLDKDAHGLQPIELEIWQGFVLIRFQNGPQPSVTELLAHFADDVARYEIPTMKPTSTEFWGGEIQANWKSVRDVDNEGYHVPIAHPALQDLYGDNYFDSPFFSGTSLSAGRFNESPGRKWSVRNYRKILPEVAHLPEEGQKTWFYIGLFPNAVIGLYPDSVMFYQEIPTAIGTTVQRGATYKYPDESRELRLARYLSSRIDRDTALEDQQLIQWSWEAAKSSAYQGVILSNLEYGVRSYHDCLREVIPVFNESEAPAEGNLARLNSELLRNKAS
jgi:phenylpropionate dioxygenase-like ring-hydroxylating dioxygenase large terminal subunit